MTYEEAIEILRDTPIDIRSSREDDIYTLYATAQKMALDALQEKDRMEEMWLDDMDNPLEPIKLKSALDSELFKLNYRKEHKPKEINILDYTVIYALIYCLEEMAGKKND